MQLKGNIISYCLLLNLFLISNLFAQLEVAWNKTYDSSSREMGISVQQTRDNGFIILGGTYLSSEKDDIILIKTDSSGNEIWKKRYDSGKHDLGNTVFQTEDDGFIVFGSALNNYAWLIKVDHNGDTLWTKKYNHGNGHSMLPTDSGYVLLGRSLMPQDSILWISNIDNLGNLTSTNYIPTLFNSPDSGNIMFDKTEFSITGYKILASSIFGGTQIIQTDEKGNIIWMTDFLTYGYGRSFYSGIVGVECEEDRCVPHADSGMVIVGELDSKLGIIKTTFNDEILWNKSYSLFNGYTIGKSLFRANDGGYIITGEVDRKVFLSKIDVSGNLLWERILGDGEGKKVFQTNNDEIVVCGESNENIFLTKLSFLPAIIIEGDSIWYDEDWDGSVTGNFDASSSYTISGYPITNYQWKYKDEVVGTNSILEIELSTGDNVVELTVTDENGISNTTQKVIKVCSYKLETEGPITSSISTIGDSVFFATSTDDQVYCFDNKNQLKWTLAIGGDIQSTTTIGPNENIYVGSDDLRLYCFDPKGNSKWDTPMGGIVTASPAITQEKIVYVGTENYRLYSVDGDDGSVNWNYLTGGSINSSVAIASTGDIYFGSSDKKFYSLNSSGTLNWNYETNGEINSSPAIDTLGRVYFGSNDGKLYSLNSDGSLNWSYTTEGPILSSPVIDSEGNIYFGSGDSKFYVLDDEGGLIWTFVADTTVYGNPALVENGDVIFGCEDGKIYSLSSTGELNWHYKTGASVRSAPLVTNIGRIYIGSSDKSLYGFMDPSYVLKKASSINHQWPTFQKDNKRTGSQVDIQTSVKNEGNIAIPKEFSLKQNYPNPFNPSTKIEFQVTETSDVTLTIYNINGEEVKALVNETIEAGFYSTQWNGLNNHSNKVGSGIYFYKINVVGEKNTYLKTMKMIKLK